jgi:hypothetical protein
VKEVFLSLVDHPLWLEAFMVELEGMKNYNPNLDLCFWMTKFKQFLGGPTNLLLLAP